MIISFGLPFDLAGQTLPGLHRDFEFDTHVASLDLENAERWKFHRKAGGTSIGVKISEQEGRNIGVFLPENSSTNLECEVVSYRLACLIGVSQLYNPVTYYNLGPNASKRFKSMIRYESNKWRRRNAYSISKAIRNKPELLFGIYKYRSKRETQSADVLVRNNGFNTYHSFSSWIRGSRKMPPKSEIGVSRIRKENPEDAAPVARADMLARQLSVIFCMDMLTGQWDRFSGGNLEMFAYSDGSLQFVARDNGGGGFNSHRSWFNKYARWVTRFDKAFVGEVRALNDFLTAEKDSYKGIESPDQLLTILGFRSPDSSKYFKKNLVSFLSHVDRCEQRYGDSAFF